MPKLKDFLANLDKKEMSDEEFESLANAVVASLNNSIKKSMNEGTSEEENIEWDL